MKQHIWLVIVLVAIGYPLQAPAAESARPAGNEVAIESPHLSDDGSLIPSDDWMASVELVQPKPPFEAVVESAHELEGVASWYGVKFQGRRTANGETFDTNEMTAAHKTLPFDTMVRVTNLDTERSTVVRINDRGPFIPGRIIDLARAAADGIGITTSGVAPVRLTILRLGGVPARWAIQIAAFSQRDNAVDLARQLEGAGLEPVIEQDGEQGFHRVVLHDIAPADLQGYRSKLADIGYSKVLVRPSR